jgi:glycosyltransferase involved in cell wall biosynthesis
MMRIVFFTNAYKPRVSGVVTSISLFRQGLIDAGHRVHIVAPEQGEYEDEEPYVFRLPAIDMPGEIIPSLAIPLKVPIDIALRGIRPSLIHSHHPILMGDLAEAFARELEIPLVFTFHTRYDEYAEHYFPIAPELAGMVVEQIVALYLEKCAHIITPTASIRDFILREYGPSAPVTIVPTPVNLSAYEDLAPGRVQADLGLQGAEVLLYVGRIAGEKGLDFLLRVFARIVTERSRVRLLLVGDGPCESELKKLARELGIGDQVLFCGAVPHSEVPHYAAAADLFVFSSVTETQGLVLIEAMAAGTPIVAVEAPGSMDILDEGGGLLVPQQEEVFAEAVVDLLRDRRRLEALGRQATRVVQRYTIPTATERLSAVYQATVAAGRRVGE